MTVTIQNKRLILQYGVNILWIDPWGPDGIRVRMSAEPEMDGRDFALTEPVMETDAYITSEKTDMTDPWYREEKWERYHMEGTVFRLINGKITAEVGEEGWITFLDAKGNVLLKEYWRNRDRVSRYALPLGIPARELKAVPGTSDYSLTAVFEADANERIYGMGQYQVEAWNKKAWSWTWSTGIPRPVCHSIFPASVMASSGIIRRSERSFSGPIKHSGAFPPPEKWIIISLREILPRKSSGITLW